MSSFNKDIYRAIGHINLVLDECGSLLWEEEIEDLNKALNALQRLAKT